MQKECLLCNLSAFFSRVVNKQERLFGRLYLFFCSNILCCMQIRWNRRPNLLRKYTVHRCTLIFYKVFRLKKILVRSYHRTNNLRAMQHMRGNDLRKEKVILTHFLPFNHFRTFATWACCHKFHFPTRTHITETAKLYHFSCSHHKGIMWN